MSIWTSAFIAFGILIAILGASVFFFHSGDDVDKRTRQTALLFVVVGLVVAAFTALATIMPSHPH